MANQEHLVKLRQGVDAWNAWRKQCPSIRPDLSDANLEEERLSNADLRQADLSSASLVEADLVQADLRGAILKGAKLRGSYLMRAKLSFAVLEGADTDLSCAHLGGADISEVHARNANMEQVDLGEANASKADLRDANLRGAHFRLATLSGAFLSGADLRNANLIGALLVGTKLVKADLTGCLVYGVSTWDLKLEGAKQRDLVITRPNEPEITVDDIEVAQFIYLLLNYKKIRDVIVTIISKAVLILGSFKDERKAVLDSLREDLRNRHYLPILFDFKKLDCQTTLETLSTLAHMARFVIADLSDAKSVLQELQAVIPNNPSVPVQPLLLAGQEEPGMFDFFVKFRSVLTPHYYESPKRLIADLSERVIGPAEAKVRELRGLMSTG